MYRKIVVLTALSALAEIPSAFAATHTAHHPSAATATKSRVESKAEAKSYLVRTASSHSKHGDTVALAPREAEIDGWRVKLAAAGPASEVTQDLMRFQDQEPVDHLSVVGMVVAALGIGGISIVRRMGRL